MGPVRFLDGPVRFERACQVCVTLFAGSLICKDNSEERSIINYYGISSGDSGNGMSCELTPIRKNYLGARKKYVDAAYASQIIRGVAWHVSSKHPMP